MATYTKKSNITGKVNTIDLPISEEELEEGLRRREGGDLIQNCFPTLPAPLREFIMTGITPEEWDEHINPIECQTCKRRMDEDYTIGCPECFEHEHAEEEEEHGGRERDQTDGEGGPETPRADPDGGPQLP